MITEKNIFYPAIVKSPKGWTEIYDGVEGICPAAGVPEKTDWENAIIFDSSGMKYRVAEMILRQGTLRMCLRLIGLSIFRHFILEEIGKYTIDELKKVCIEHEPDAKSEINRIDNAKKLLKYISEI
jgi:hypothetical protein